MGEYTRAGALPEQTAQQFMVGMNDQDLGTFEDLAEAFSYTDDGVYVYSVVAHHDSASYVWLKWYGGDTEVGYLFPTETLEMVAEVSDGEIIDCTAKAPK